LAHTSKSAGNGNGVKIGVAVVILLAAVGLLVWQLGGFSKPPLVVETPTIPVDASSPPPPEPTVPPLSGKNPTVITR